MRQFGPRQKPRGLESSETISWRQLCPVQLAHSSPFGFFRIPFREFWADLSLGFFYANGFEYCLHRFILHGSRGIFRQEHMVHHTTLNSPEAARYVNFSSNPWGVVALFLRQRRSVFNSAVDFPQTAGQRECSWASRSTTSRLRKFTGACTWAAGCREWLRPAARHHLIHHAHDPGRFNVFLPLFDWLAGIASPAGANPRRRSER